MCCSFAAGFALTWTCLVTVCATSVELSPLREAKIAIAAPSPPATITTATTFAQPGVWRASSQKRSSCRLPESRRLLCGSW